MSKTATLTLTLSVTGDGINDQSIPIAAWQNTSSPAYRFSLTLSSGDNDLGTLIPPTALGTTLGYLIVTFPTAVTIKIKGVTGDSGCPMVNTGGTLVIPPGVSAPVLNASASCAVTVWVV